NPAGLSAPGGFVGLKICRDILRSFGLRIGRRTPAWVHELFRHNQLKSKFQGVSKSHLASVRSSPRYTLGKPTRLHAHCYGRKSESSKNPAFRFFKKMQRC